MYQIWSHEANSMSQCIAVLKYSWTKFVENFTPNLNFPCLTSKSDTMQMAQKTKASLSQLI